MIKNKFFLFFLVSIFFFPFYVFADNSGEIAINVKNETNVFTYNNTSKKKKNSFL